MSMYQLDQLIKHIIGFQFDKRKEQKDITAEKAMPFKIITEISLHL